VVRVGISGWLYPPWRGVFYPRGLRQKSELEFASRAFETIEINGSFYSLMRPETYQSWYEETPPGFEFAVKGGRYITHMKRLANIETGLANFFASGVLRLREKLGPFLWQLPPTLAFDERKLASFLAQLPRTTSALAALASRHDSRLAGRAETRAFVELPVRHALEPRHPSFRSQRYLALLREFSVAHCVADSAGQFPYFEDVTAPFVYARLHGAEQLYASGYDVAALRAWADRVRAWTRGSQVRSATLAAPEALLPRAPRDVYVYFDNDVKVRAPFDAANLRRLLDGQAAVELPSTLEGVTEVPRTLWPAWENLARAPKTRD